MELQKRPNGFYWVLYDRNWEVAEWDDYRWQRIGGEALFYDRDFTKIDERPLFYDHKLDRPVRKKKKYLRFTKNKKQ